VHVLSCWLSENLTLTAAIHRVPPSALIQHRYGRHRDSLSRAKKKTKHRLTGSKRKPERTGPDARGERVDPSGSLPQPEPRVAASGGHEDISGGHSYSATLTSPLRLLPVAASTSEVKIKMFRPGVEPGTFREGLM